MTLCPATPALSCDDDHVYRLAGKVVPGVTQILSDLNLIDGKEWMLPKHSERGQRIHKATALHDQDKLEWASIDAETGPYLMAWIEFCKDHNFQAIEIEEPFYFSPFNYAGCYDRTGIWHEECKVLIDIKTVTAWHPIPKWWSWQLSGYAIPQPGDLERVNVVLIADGTFRLAAPHIEARKADQQFLNMVEIWWEGKSK